MGLDIKRYSHSYSTLHLIRQLALTCEGNYTNIHDFYVQESAETSFSALINHSDCDGIYVSKSSKQYEKLKRKWKHPVLFGDLDKLKEECERLNKWIHSLNETDYSTLSYGILNAWDHFYEDVKSARKILEFH